MDDRAFKVERWKRMKLLSHMLKQGRAADPAAFLLLKEDAGEAGDGLKKLLNELQRIRGQMKPYKKMDFRMREKARARARLNAYFKCTDRRTLFLNLGNRATARRDTDRGAARFIVTIGHMWNHKVFHELYHHTTHELGDWVILSADKVRTNSKLVTLYEVKAMNSGTGELTTGYVAKTIAEQPTIVFGRNVQKALKAAERAINEQLNKIFTGDQ